MKMRLLGALLAAVGVLAAGASTALASDAGVTQTYLQANYALVRVARSHLATSEAGPLHVLARVRSECPEAGTGSPQDPESTQMSNEVIGAMVVSAAQPDLSAMKTFVSVAAHLRWSNGALTHTIQQYVRNVETVLGLSAPNLCADVKAWAADGFTALPPSTVAFVNKFFPAWVALGFQPPQLTRYENGAAKAAAKRTDPLELALTEGESRAVAHWGDIMNALVLWP